MMNIQTIVLAGVLGAVATLAGCTTTAGGDPTPDNDATEHPGSTPPNSDRNGAPPVDTPLDPTRFLTDPCATLTQAQLARFRIDTPGEPDTDSGVANYAGPSCVWSASDASETFGVGFITANKNGLADLYGARERDAYFEETSINGYPAVFRDLRDRRDIGACSIDVGVTDNLTFLVQEQGELDAQGACDRAKEVAGAVITTMKGA